MSNIQLALTLLLAGFIIVFMVLIALILIIMLYGKIIQKAQKTVEVRREKKAIIRAEKEAENAPEKTTPAGGMVFGGSDEIPGEIIAVIAAAVDSLYGDKPHKIRSVSRSRKGRSSWGNAGVIQNTKPF